MALFTEGDWTYPYERFRVSDIGRKSQAYDEMIRDLGITDTVQAESKQMLLNEQIMPLLEDDGDVIDFDYAYVARGNPTRTEDGDQVYYPFGVPNPQDLRQRQSRNPVKNYHVVPGHGDLSTERAIPLSHLESHPEGGLVYPFKMLIEANKQGFHTYPRMSEDPDLGIIAHYGSWVPINDEDFPGLLYVPRQLPKLMGMRFKLERFEHWEFDLVNSVRK